MVSPQTAAGHIRAGSPLLPSSTIRMHRNKINLTAVRTGQTPGSKQADDGIWLVGTVRDDPGDVDPEQETLPTIDSPRGTRPSPGSLVQTVARAWGPDPEGGGAPIRIRT